MKKALAAFLLVLAAAGCGILPPQKRTVSDSTMSTRIAQILTVLPTNTPRSVGVTTQPEATRPASSPTPEPSSTSALHITGTVDFAATAQPSSVPVKTTPLAATPTLGESAAAAAAVPSATATFAPGDPRAHLGVPTWSDTMDTSANWPGGNNDFTSIGFKDGHLLLTGLKKMNGWRITNPDVNDFYIEMKVRTGACKGEDRYGMIVRVPDHKTADQGYWLLLTCNGKYALQKWDGKQEETSKQVTTLISWTAIPAIKAGPDQVNAIGLLALGSKFTVYINGIKLKEAKDDTFAKGAFGVMVGPRETENFTVFVDEMDYWSNPFMN